MKKAPVRWLDGGGGSDRARSLLSHAGDADPPEGAERAVWTALLGRLPPPDPGGGFDAGGGAAGGGALGALKAAGLGVLAGLVVSTGALVATSGGGDAVHPSAPPAPTPAAALAPAPAAEPEPQPEPVQPVEPPRVAARAPVPSATAATSVGALEPSESERKQSQLLEESRALSAARDALRRGDAAGALATVEAVRARFPASVLGQEREALTIQALAQAGQRDAARSRARAFLAKFPKSPHAASLARFAE